MATVTFQVVEGVDKGRIFREVGLPVTIGREEGNLLRLNDERVSRFHAKVQQDDGDFVLTDLESTNGTRVNGAVVQIRRLRFGDQISVGRSRLLFGSTEQIAARMASLEANAKPLLGGTIRSGGGYQDGPATIRADSIAYPSDENVDFDLNVNADVTEAEGHLYIGNHRLPPLPKKLSPAQAARFAEILDFLHQHLTRATENIHANDEASQVVLAYSDWQRVLTMQMLLARSACESEPDSVD